MEGMKKELNDCHTSLIPTSLYYNNVLVDEFNLKWCNINIEDALRKWAKNLMFIYNKAELMNLSVLKDLFGRSINYNINWKKTFLLL